MEVRKPLGLYFHIPFCRQKCVYCDFYSLPRREDRMQAYTDAPRRGLRPAEGYRVDTVYFGGGTPSYLGPERLGELLAAVFRVFDVDPDAEITLEANPDSAGDPDALRRLRDAGFNRLSLGMQSASDRALAALGRVHTMAQTRAAVDAARRAGFENLSLDLIYGLPGQSAADWRESLDAAMGLGPEHLSCYGLKAEKGTPLYARREELPGDEVQAEMYLEAVDILEGRGYGLYEISNFARPGRFSRHNWKYWTLGEYLGFGPGAHSDFGGRRWAWERDLEAWIAGRARRSESQTPTEAERRREWLMLGLRTARGLDPEELRRRGGDFAPLLPFLERCREAGYACRENGRWRLTPAGFLVSNPIIGELLERLEAAEKGAHG